MRNCCLLILMPLALSACGTSDPPTPPEPFDIDGAWLYLGPSDVPHKLTIGQGQMAYADVDGHWSSNWTLKTYDNQARHFQLVFASGAGTYLPVGQSLSGAYEVTGTLLTVQLGKDPASYPPLTGAGTCTGTDGMPVPECRLYVKN